jgi:serine/threonine protein kinase
VSSDNNRGIFQIGDVLNNTYRIDKVLGRGGTSEVYRAKSEISGRVVAIKALRTEFSRNEDFLALMTREEDMREIRHDAIVRYYDNQRTDDGHVYLVMDYVDGPGLDRKLKDGGMSADDLMVVCKRVAEGLVAAHAKNIVHRDMSPDNIILRDGDPADAVIIDFGIAKDTNPGAETIVGNEFAGKYAYAAPEQLSGQTDARADVYALGALLLSTFRGKSPNIGNNPMEVIQNKAAPLDTTGVPDPLKSLIDRMTQPDREMRLQTAQAVLDEIVAPQPMPVASVAQPDDDDSDRTIIVPRSVTKETPKPATPPAPPPAPPPARSKAAPAKTPVAGTPSQVKKSRGVLMPALAAIVVVAVGGGAYVSGVLDGLFGPSYPPVDPYTLIASRSENGLAQAVGYVPSESANEALGKLIEQQGGITELTLASGDIPDTWDTDVIRLIDTVSHLPEWRVLADSDRVRISGLTYDATEQRTLTAALSQDGMKGAFDAIIDIDLGPRVLTAGALNPILKRHKNCGKLDVIDAPATGYPNGSQVIVTGRVADIKTRVALSDDLVAAIGDRDLVLEVDVLNPTLCLVDSVLPNVPQAAIDVEFRVGPSNEINTSGHYFVGENPVIDVVIPSEMTDGYLFVSALDVSGNVFHLLPNLLFENNSITDLRDGRTGRVSVRVAYSLDDAADGTKLAFVVDDTALGKTKVIVIHSEDQIFEGLRPTTESAGGYANALAMHVGTVTSLDSRILTTAKQ